MAGTFDLANASPAHDTDRLASPPTTAADRGLSRRVGRVGQAMAAFEGFFASSEWARRAGDPRNCDFVLGNPHEMPIEGFGEALARWSVPRSADWFAYKVNEAGPREIIAASLRAERGRPYEAEDVFLTNGAFAALSVALTALADPGDEVVFVSPPWFFYEALIEAVDARPVRVRADPDTFDLDLDAIAAAMTERTRAIIVNSPNNPTGRIYPSETLAGLARVLTEASERNGRPVWLLSDEAYRRIVYDGRTFESPAEHYPSTLVLYTYGKALLTPGQRIGYVALPPTMPDRTAVRQAMFSAQIATGFAFPNALLQHALPDLETLSVDVAQLERKRDRMVSGLRDAGFDLVVPEGTFYLLVRSPIPDDLEFTAVLARHDVFVLPGAIVEMPGHFRVSLTASDDMIDRGLPGFQAALREVAASA